MNGVIQPARSLMDVPWTISKQVFSRQRILIKVVKGLLFNNQPDDNGDNHNNDTGDEEPDQRAAFVIVFATQRKNIGEKIDDPFDDRHGLMFLWLVFDACSVFMTLY